MFDNVKSWLTWSAEESTVRSVKPKLLSTVTGPEDIGQAAEQADQDRVLTRLAVDVERAARGGRLDEGRVVAGAGVQGCDHGVRLMLVIVPSTVNVLPPEPPKTVKLLVSSLT